jgi:sugar-specific transcriptional regulator TrmB
MLINILNNLDFKEEEVNTYLALLDSGPSSGGQIAKQMGIPRPTAYLHLDKLLNGGLATQTMKRGVKIYVPEPSDKIRLLYQRRINDLKAKEKLLDTILPELDKRSGSTFMRPKIQIFEGKNGIEEALQDFMNYPDMTIKSFWSIKSAIEVTSKDFFWYINVERLKKNIHIEAIWPPQQTIDIRENPYMGVGEEFKREIRIAPEGTDSTMGYWIYANKVLFASSVRESFCFIIESAELFEMMNNQHKVLWNISTPINPKPEDMKPFLDEFKDL